MNGVKDRSMKTLVGQVVIGREPKACLKQTLFNTNFGEARMLIDSLIEKDSMKFTPEWSVIVNMCF